ncbi:MAG: VTT domain-containing protein [Chloroflexi bacterium]|nr:VTT domain-containing protein [Chloroflexota bacterium]MBI3340077.1 VTT domain-containing protein [Chloroflexota bacterium]
MNNLVDFFQTIVFYIKGGQLPEMGIWTYLLLAVLVAIEGPIATLLGAAAASAGLMRPWSVFFAAAIGNITADTLWYSIGYMGRIEWLFHFGKRLGLRRDLLEHLKHNMDKHATKILFLAKLTVSFVIPSLITAGLLRLPLRRWFPALIVAETIWTGSLVLIGFYTTEAIKRVERGIEYAVLTASILFVIFLILAGRRLIKAWDKDEPDAVSNKS